MAPSATPKSFTTGVKGKLSPLKLDPPQSSTTTKPEKVIIKSKNNVLEQTSPNTSQLASKFDAMFLSSSPASSPTKRVYHASPAKENRVQQNNNNNAVEKLQIT